MSKVICEICGTAYPDTENECPVCGFEKTETAEMIHEEETSAENPAYVKGGRFSKGNVSKKNKAAERGTAAPAKRRSKKKRKSSDRGLIIAIIVLLLAIIVTGAYIYINYFAPGKAPDQDSTPAQTTTEPSKETLPPHTTAATETADLSCTGLTLYEESVILKEAGGRWLLNVVPTPANTTDSIVYTSGDESVATVSAGGEITAVANGETVITITCGEVTVQCKVVCQLAEATEPQETEPDTTDPEETDPEETEPEETKPEETKPQDAGDFKLRKEDITFDGKGQTYKLYNGDIDVTKIVWTVGNTSVATVKDGVVKAVGSGTTTVYAEYNGVKLSCIIRCQF